jgi:hypothetical protein
LTSHSSQNWPRLGNLPRDGRLEQS